MNDYARLRARLEKQAKRMRKAERERSTILSQTVYTGTLGLVLVLPVVAGAFLGNWLDGMAPDYSVKWTVGMILLGLVVGIVNVYYLTREGD